METPSVASIPYQVLGSFKHDSTLFTEGLEYFNGKLFESTGSPEELTYTESKIVAVDTISGKVLTKSILDKKLYFGEGITFLNGKVYQVTYRTQKGFVYDANTFKKLKEFTFQNAEGWGLTNDGQYVIMSDGTYELTFFDPETFKVLKKLSIKENGYAKTNINELEYVDGFIYANVWQTDEMIKINAKNGEIVGKVDLSGLRAQALVVYAGSMETNGIAYDKNSKTFLVTGKMWPKYFRIKI
jgi:glutaminyl-peptide cyclotransferase